MFCPNCKRSLPNGVEVCTFCNFRISVPSEEVQLMPISAEIVSQKSELDLSDNPKKSKRKTAIKAITIVLLATFIAGGIFYYKTEYTYNKAVTLFQAQDYVHAKELFSSLVGYKNSQAYQISSIYGLGIQEFNSSNYTVARSLFEQVPDYQESAAYIKESIYRQAIVDIDAREYDNAIALLDELGTYSNSSEYLDKALSGRKYSLFNKDVTPSNLEYIQSEATAEDRLEDIIYGTWYEKENSSSISIDKYTIDNRYYGIKQIIDIDSHLTVTAYYLDEPENEFIINNNWIEFNYIDYYIGALTINNNSSITDYYEITSTALHELQKADEEARVQYESRPNYSDNEIIQKTYSMFKNKIGSYYSGAATLYHSADYSDAYVDYDWTSRTYTCTMTGQYTTNIFDFWGTSTETYYVYAVYRDTGSGLAMIDFSIS